MSSVHTNGIVGVPAWGSVTEEEEKTRSRVWNETALTRLDPSTYRL